MGYGVHQTPTNVRITTKALFRIVPELDDRLISIGTQIMSKWGIAILAVIFLMLQLRLWHGERSLSEISSLKTQIADKTVEIDAQKRVNKALQGQVNDLMSRTDTVEEISRSELMLVKPGEVFVVIPSE